MQWVGLHCVIMVFSGHAYSLFGIDALCSYSFLVTWQMLMLEELRVIQILKIFKHYDTVLISSLWREMAIG